MLEQDIRQKIQSELPGLKILDLKRLSADMSLRSYFRLQLQGFKLPTALVMYFDSVRCPEHEAEIKIGADQACLELSKFFLENHWPVPELYLDCLEQKFLMIEDLGDEVLAQVLYNTSSATDSQLELLMNRAIDLIGLLQEISIAGSKQLSLQRRFSTRVYVKEMEEFSAYYLTPQMANARLRAKLADLFTVIAESFEQFPKVLVHRDFHTGNLMVDTNNRLRVIDFQDALIGPRFYDLVSLINDRDADIALGPILYRRLFEKFSESILMQPHDSADTKDRLRIEYAVTLLQRDLKVVGRLSKMVVERGQKQYQKWVPNTVARIARSLKFLSTAVHEERLLGSKWVSLGLNELLRELAAVSPEFKIGVDQKPWF